MVPAECVQGAAVPWPARPVGPAGGGARGACWVEGSESTAGAGAEWRPACCKSLLTAAEEVTAPPPPRAGAVAPSTTSDDAGGPLCPGPPAAGVALASSERRRKTAANDTFSERMDHAGPGPAPGAAALGPAPLDASAPEAPPASRPWVLLSSPDPSALPPRRATSSLALPASCAGSSCGSACGADCCRCCCWPWAPGGGCWGSGGGADPPADSKSRSVSAPENEPASLAASSWWCPLQATMDSWWCPLQSAMESWSPPVERSSLLVPVVEMSGDTISLPDDELHVSPGAARFHAPALAPAGEESGPRLPAACGGGVAAAPASPAPALPLAPALGPGAEAVAGTPGADPSLPRAEGPWCAAGAVELWEACWLLQGWFKLGGEPRLPRKKACPAPAPPALPPPPALAPERPCPWCVCGAWCRWCCPRCPPRPLGLTVSQSPSSSTSAPWAMGCRFSGPRAPKRRSRLVVCAAPPKHAAWGALRTQGGASLVPCGQGTMDAPAPASQAHTA